jgi:hypothetical protein
MSFRVFIYMSAFKSAILAMAALLRGPEWIEAPRSEAYSAS